MSEEHPFAQYVRTLGKGPNLSRPLTREETADALRYIMRGDVEPVQLGAFLCLMRVKTETPEEVAGFVDGVRDFLPKPTQPIAVDLDWASYAGKARQLPWFLLSVLLLAQSGVKVFMHGTEGHTPGRLYARETLEYLGLPIARSMDDVAAHITARNFAYLPLEFLSPRLFEIMSLRHLLGVRSPIHTIARKLNPLDAPAQMLSVSHPPYLPVHQEASRMLGQTRMAVFKGEGGEVERRPQKPCVVHTVINGETGVTDWPALMTSSAQAKDEVMDKSRLLAVWTGTEDDPYAVATITGTAAVALHLMGRAGSPEEAQNQADSLWEARSRERPSSAA